MSSIKLTGINAVQANLDKEVKKIKGHTMAGLIEGAIIIRRETEKGTPRTPLDTGNLRASWFTVVSTGAGEQSGGNFKGEEASEMSSNHSAVMGLEKANMSGKFGVAIGYSANYASFVHEKVDAKFKRPNSGAKWFEAAVEKSKPEIMRVLIASAQVK